MFSAHGVAPTVHEEAAERKLATIVLTIGLRTGPNPVRSGQSFLHPRNPARTPAVGPQRRMAGGLRSRPHTVLDRWLPADPVPGYHRQRSCHAPPNH
jgi:hypothetical protein